MTKAAVRRRWHAIAGPAEREVLRIDCDTEDRADQVAGWHRRQHPDVRVVHVLDSRSAAPAGDAPPILADLAKAWHVLRRPWRRWSA